MGKLICNQEKVNESNIEELLKVCPFGAIEYTDGKVQVNAGCKMCKICVKKGPAGVMEFIETETKKIDKSLWKGIAVYVEHVEGTIHPVTMELIGKARELAAVVDFPVYCIFIGHNCRCHNYRKISCSQSGRQIQNRFNCRLHHTGNEGKHRSCSDKTGFWRQYYGSDYMSKYKTPDGYGQIQDHECTGETV